MSSPREFRNKRLIDMIEQKIKNSLPRSRTDSTEGLFNTGTGGAFSINDDSASTSASNSGLNVDSGLSTNVNDVRFTLGDTQEESEYGLGDDLGDGLRQRRGPSDTQGSSKNLTGSLNLLSQKYESLDYDIVENILYYNEVRPTRHFKYSYWRLIRTDLLRWTIIFFIGALTALTACGIVIAVDLLSQVKFDILKSQVDQCSATKRNGTEDNCLLKPLGTWLAFNAIPVALGSFFVTYFAPVAAGSGIPVIKCYLNGIKVPEVVRVKTFLAKAFGVVTSVVGGLACGKEGPMIHCGAIIAAGISQGKSTTLGRDFKVLYAFREDREKRDFVSAGAAAGVAAAFGAPVGGVLFSLEEGASFWNQALTWRIFFCSMVSSFSLNLVLSAYHGRPGELAYPGLVNFGKMDDQLLYYDFKELPIYVLMGALGGLFGALYNYVNYRLTVFRMRFLSQKWIKVVEACLVAMCTAVIGFLMIIYVNECHQVDPDRTIEHKIDFQCPDGSYNIMGTFWFNTPEATVRGLLHDQPASAFSLALFFVAYLCLACWTYGLSVSAGLFIPTLLAGAAGGRLIGIGLQNIFPTATWIKCGKFALIGAAAMLGGVVRMTISLTVILIEATGNITFGLPIMITLMVAKWVGDFFNEGLYDIHIQLNSVPFLHWEPPVISSNVYASEVMSTPVTVFRVVEKVGRIVEVLRNETHNGFPVVDLDTPPEDYDRFRDRSDSLVSQSYTLTDGEQRRSFGRFRGLILRWQLIVMLKNKIFNETAEHAMDLFQIEIFRNAYPRYPTIESIISSLSETELSYNIDLRPVMNPSAYTISHSASLPRIFRFFRALGLRHLVVVDDRNQVIGIVTRKDLARYRNHFKGGQMVLQEVLISRN